MLDNIKLENILFLDIETVPQYPEFQKAPPDTQALWSKKCEKLKRDPQEEAHALYPRAGIYAEFGKIICISAGYITTIDKDRVFRVKSFSGEDEKQILTDFISLINAHFNKKSNILCAHNGKEFDFPFVARRILVNGLKIPQMLQIAGKKPWEIPHLDTMELWKFGDYKNYTSLDLLASIFGIPTPKDDIDGSQVGTLYWQHNDLERITRYCQKDVLTVAQLLLRFRGEPIMENESVIVAD